MPRNRNKTPCSVPGCLGRRSRSLDWPQLGDGAGSLPTLGTVVQCRPQGGWVREGLTCCHGQSLG